MGLTNVEVKVINPLFVTDTLSVTLRKMVTDEASVTNKGSV